MLLGRSYESDPLLKHDVTLVIAAADRRVEQRCGLVNSEHSEDTQTLWAMFEYECDETLDWTKAREHQSFP